MKNNNNFLKVAIGIIAIILFCWGMIWMLDQAYNGVIKEWFFRLFYFEPNYSSDGKIGVLFKSWSEIKNFFIYSFVGFVVFFVACMSMVYFYARSKSKKELFYIVDKLNTFIMSESDDLHLPKKYSEIENQFIKIKSVTQKHQQLMQMEMQRKNDLITYLAHDLKTPLASVIGYLSLLEEAADMPTEQKAKYTGIALEKAYRLEELINEFFEITRFNLQTIVLNTGKINLSYMLQQMADEFYPMLAPQKKQVSVSVSEDIILTGDADKLARVFNNILKNAIAYSYKDSIITISAIQQDDRVIISFKNQGDPIPAQKLETIFEKFYRLDSARSTNTGGAGLGLAIAQEIITAHNGKISVESNLECTTFTVSLPI